MMRTIKCLLLGLAVLTLAGTNAFASVDANLNADSPVGNGSDFNVTIDLAGADAVAGMSLIVTFDNTLVEVKSITAGSMSPVVPTDMTIVNTDGSFKVSYAVVAGFVPDTDSLAATITCGAKAIGSAVFGFTDASKLSGTGFPIPDVKGTLTGKTVDIVDPLTLNAAPTATGSEITTDEDTTATGTLIAEDADGDVLTYSIVTAASKGVVTITNATSGEYEYVPTANENGSDTFTFKVNDGKVDSEDATMLVIITAANDAPVAEAGTLETAEDTSVAGQLVATDADGGDTLTYSVAVEASKGVVSITDISTGKYQYVPNDDEVGSDTFSFTVTDAAGLASTAEVTVTLTPVNDAPEATEGTLEAILGMTAEGTLEASDVDGDSLTYSVVDQGTMGIVKITDEATGAYTYTPNPDATVGSDTFTFKANDGAVDSGVATVAVTLEAGIYNITVTAGSGGTVTTDPEAVVDAGEPVVVTVTPEATKDVDMFMVNGVDMAAELVSGVYTFTPTADVAIVVSFKEAVMYNITATAMPANGGTLDPAGAFQAKDGAELTFTVTPMTELGWEVESAVVNGESVTIADDDTFTVTVDADLTIDVVFAGGKVVSSADTDYNNRISMSELLRGMQLFSNGAYHCDPAGPEDDGYAAGKDASAQDCERHTSDYQEPYWVITLSEFLRLTQFYNLNGYYEASEGTETVDGFVPGVQP